MTPGVRVEGAIVPAAALIEYGSSPARIPPCFTTSLPVNNHWANADFSGLALAEILDALRHAAISVREVDQQDHQSDADGHHPAHHAGIHRPSHAAASGRPRVNLPVGVARSGCIIRKLFAPDRRVAVHGPLPLEPHLSLRLRMPMRPRLHVLAAGAKDKPAESASPAARGKVQDPICKRWIDPSKATATAMRADEEFSFCSEGCYRAFQTAGQFIP